MPYVPCIAEQSSEQIPHFHVEIGPGGAILGMQGFRPIHRNTEVFIHHKLLGESDCLFASKRKKSSGSSPLALTASATV